MLALFQRRSRLIQGILVIIRDTFLYIDILSLLHLHAITRLRGRLGVNDAKPACMDEKLLHRSSGSFCGLNTKAQRIG